MEGIFFTEDFQKKIQLINTYLNEKLAPYLVYIYGSTVKGSTHKDSDIDIAFLSDSIFNQYEMFIIGEGLANLLDCEVDLVDLSNASTVMQAQIIKSGKVIQSKDEKRRMEFEMVILKKYAKLNEERQPIIQRIKEDGAING